MPYYHIYIIYVNKQGKKVSLFAFDWPKKSVENSVVRPYMKNKPFIFIGRPIHPSSIEIINIYETEKRSYDLILPNGKTVSDENIDYVAVCFDHGEVKGVVVRTDEFFILPPEERKKRLSPPIKPLGKKGKVFIVHGRDEKQALRLQKYLKDKLKVDAVMFDDLSDKGRTIIEQLEYIRDNVGYAFIIATPDDVGCLTEDIEKLGRMLASLRSVKGQTVAKIFEMLQKDLPT